MGLLDNAAALAVRMINKFGANVTLARVTRGAYDAATDTRAPDIVTTVVVRAVEQPYTPLMGVGMGLTFEQQSAILADARSFLIAGRDAPFPPAPAMTIETADGRRYTISSVKTDAPDCRPILYTCAAKVG